MNEDNNHEELIEAYLAYFKANEWWETKHSVRAYSSVQKALRDIRKIAKDRITEVRLQQRQFKINNKGEDFKKR